MLAPGFSVALVTTRRLWTLAGLPLSETGTVMLACSGSVIRNRLPPNASSPSPTIILPTVACCRPVVRQCPRLKKPISHMATSTMAMTMLTHRLLECWEMDSCFHREVEAPPPMSVAARCRTGLFMVVICDSSSVALVTSRSIHILHQLVVNMDWKFQCIRVV